MKVVALVGLCLLCSQIGHSQTRYLAFGDSLTEGAGDDEEREEKGYPPRLESLLVERGVDATVENHGLGGETTAAGLTRLDEVLLGGGDVLLLMEGTNDISRRISEETVRFNLSEMARKAEAQGLSTVYATVAPRLPTANTDGSNRATARLAGQIRDVAWAEGRPLADPFEVFITSPNVFQELYVGDTDRLHPNAAGYDRLSEVFADVLTGVDSVAPVTGLLSPADEARGVADDVTVEVRLYDFGAGIDVEATVLRVNGQDVDAVLEGDASSVFISYLPPEPWLGVVTLGLRSGDFAQPPHQTDVTLGQFTVEGTEFFDGDIDRDGRIDGEDLVAFAVRFGALRGDDRYRNFADFNDDDIIDGTDLAILAANFGASSF